MIWGGDAARKHAETQFANLRKNLLPAQDCPAAERHRILLSCFRLSYDCPQCAGVWARGSGEDAGMFSMKFIRTEREK